MGYAIMFGTCCNCGKQFGFNPHRVPSVRVNGHRQSVCRFCIVQANQIRKQKGIPEFEIQADAYQPINEEEL